MSKVVEYVGVFHTLKDRLLETWTQFWATEPDPNQEKETNFRAKVKVKLEKLKHRTIHRINRSSSLQDEDFSHLTRTKTRAELVRISAAVMGIEFSYAAETAFVSPLLLNLGLPRRHMTLMWLFSPLLGFFLTPILGSMSDGCRSRLGKRRPFIILLSIGIVLGLLLVPNGQLIGTWLGDKGFTSVQSTTPVKHVPPETGKQSPLALPDPNLPKRSVPSFLQDPLEPDENINPKPSYKTTYSKLDVEESGKGSNLVQGESAREREEEILKRIKLRPKELSPQVFKRSGTKTGDALSFLFQQELDKEEDTMDEQNQTTNRIQTQSNSNNNSFSSIQAGSLIKEENEEENTVPVQEPDSLANHQWGLIFTVIGTILLDFDADACQSPSRAYMLDVTIPEDHARGLSTFTIMAGLGGSLGYFLGALNWENTFIGILFGGQVRAVFTLVLFIFIACVVTTIRSFQEIPIDRLYPPKAKVEEKSAYARFEEDDPPYDEEASARNYGAVESVQETSLNENTGEARVPPTHAAVLTEDIPPTFKEYVKTIVQLPKSLQWLCVTNFFCWMSLVCYSLYFTDFVGQAVYGGDPFAPRGSIERKTYEDGVRFGCWGMSLYSLSCSIYSLLIERLVARFGAKRVYICGQLVYSVGMVFMGLARHPAGVIIFSWTAGIMYATLFTMPYLLVARYHAAETFDINVDDLVQKPSQVRGLGTDVAIVSSMVFLAQMTQAVTLGSVVAAAGTTTAIVFAAALFASCGAVAATKVLYLDL